MIIHHYNDPFNHVLIHNFFNPTELTRLDSLLNGLKNLFTTRDPSDKNQTESFIWPYENKDVEGCMALAKIIEDGIWNDEIRRMLVTTNDSSFHFYHLTSESHIEVIKKHKGWKRHEYREQYKSLTVCIALSENAPDANEVTFITETRIKKTLQLKSNSCIIFPSEIIKSFSEKTHEIPSYMIMYHAIPRYKFR